MVSAAMIDVSLTVVAFNAAGDGVFTASVVNSVVMMLSSTVA